MFLVSGVSCSQASDCSYSALLNHLKLDETNSGLQIERPVKNWNTTTEVQLEITLGGILDVVSLHHLSPLCCYFKTFCLLLAW